MQDDLKRLEQLGRTAAAAVGGTEAVERVDVRLDWDSSHHPVYLFTFLLDQSRLRTRVGLFRTQLRQKLTDELEALGDQRLPTLQTLDREAWAKWTNARPG